MDLRYRFLAVAVLIALIPEFVIAVTPAIPPGSIIVTEIMVNPKAVSDADGEYVELYNAGAETRDLQGLNLADNGTNSHVISSALSIAPGSYVALCRNSNSSQNGGLACDYKYSNFQLSNTDDEVILKQGGTVIDEVWYGSGNGWPIPNGASLSLDPDALDATSNNDPTNWCQSTSGMAGGDRGTPKSSNDECGLVYWDHRMAFIGVTGPVNGTCAWEYHVCSGTSPSISHWDLESCVGTTNPAIEWGTDPPLGGDLEYGTDPHTNITGIKFDVDMDDGQCATFWFKVKECSIAQKEAGIKAGRDIYIGSFIEGPAHDTPDTTTTSTSTTISTTTMPITTTTVPTTTSTTIPTTTTTMPTTTTTIPTTTTTPETTTTIPATTTTIITTPEYPSTAVSLAVLAIAPVLAYLVVRRHR